MALIELERKYNLHDACISLLSNITSGEMPVEHSMWRCEISSLPLENLLGAVRGVKRVFFKSRDCDFEFVGFGAADIVSATERDHKEGFPRLIKQASTLFDDQIYFGAIRFDDNAKIGPEWMPFGNALFVLPLVFLLKKNDRFTLSINYRTGSHVPWILWLDQVSTLLLSIANGMSPILSSLSFSSQNYLPSKRVFADNIHRALDAFIGNEFHKKVVIGRRNCMTIDPALDPCELFIRLKRKTRDAFFFFFDCGASRAFFGGSPELLYRRNRRDLETESLAGTRPRACDKAQDVSLREELLLSFKDNQEHSLVSMHIEEKLRDFGTREMTVSKLEIMALAYVQHLRKRYHGTIAEDVDDARILRSLHPTPAVCGLDIDWARDFIRKNEGFDRGFYAGPIGYIGNDYAEFAVAIRSALFDQQKLYIYAACGIVPGSNHNQEWDELNNKEKSILSIFDDEN